MVKQYIHRFEPCQIDMITANKFRVPQYIKRISFAKQINSKFIIQKRVFCSNSLHKKFLNHLSVILEDEKRFKRYYKKRFPKSFKYLPLSKFLIILLIFIALKIDYLTYSTITLENSSIVGATSSYSKYLFFLYFIVIVYEFVLSVYVTLKANSPVIDRVFQIGKHTVKLVGASSAFAVGYSHLPVEPNGITNFVHTRTPFGRGYDYAIGSLHLKIKGDYISGALGNADMIKAAQKHAPDSRIIDLGKLHEIINDPEFKTKIREKTTLTEKGYIGIPLAKIPDSIRDFLSSNVLGSNNLDDLPETNSDETINNSVGSDVLGSNNLDDLPETNSDETINNSVGSDVLGSNNLDDLPETNSDETINNSVGSDVSGSNNSDDLSEVDETESATPVTEESPIRRHSSEPLPQRSDRPPIQRRHTR